MSVFFSKVVTFKHDPVKAFCELHSVCLGHPDLQEMLLDLLSPSEALSLGPEIHFQHSLRSTQLVLVLDHKLGVQKNPSNIVSTFTTTKNHASCLHLKLCNYLKQFLYFKWKTLLTCEAASFNIFKLTLLFNNFSKNGILKRFISKQWYMDCYMLHN